MLAFLETRRDLGSMRDVNYGNGRKIKSCDRRGWPEKMPSLFRRSRSSWKEERIAPLRFLLLPLCCAAPFLLFFLLDIALMAAAADGAMNRKALEMFFFLSSSKLCRFEGGAKNQFQASSSTTILPSLQPPLRLGYIIKPMT